MESTAFEMLVVPVILATSGTLVACSLAAKLAGWIGWIASAFFGRADEPDGPAVFRQHDHGANWHRHGFVTDKARWRYRPASAKH